MSSWQGVTGLFRTSCAGVPPRAGCGRVGPPRLDSGVCPPLAQTMRIIAGEFKKRKLQGPPDDTTTRPIPDMVKEALFNILRGHPEDGAVLDCFAGTGSIGLEALSRGAPRCVFVERDKKIV